MDLFQMIRWTNEVDKIFSAIDEADVNMVGKDGQNLLHTAIAYNKSEIGIELINRHIDVNRQNNEGMTPLHYTAWFHNLKLAELILQHDGNPNIRDKHGNNSLWYAVVFSKGKNYDLVELLLNAGADIATKNGHGRSPFDFAKQTNNSHMLQLLTGEK